MNTIPEKVMEFIRQQAEDAGFFLVEVSVKGNKVFSLDVALDKKGGITIGECTAFNRKITSWLDEQELFSSGYTVDVNSPGLDRELKSDTAFLWAKGKEVEVRLCRPIEAGSSIMGKLVEGSMSGDVVIESPDGVRTEIERDNVAKVKLNITKLK